ncbi:MAG: hypothetical protein K2J13_02450, partial [Clostridia bacterium]|nr:hypothetical protein [Clostridia bacterium]
SLYWNFAFDYLQTLREFPELIDDKGFFELYDKLMDYVDDKIALPNDGNIKDIYVIVEQEVPVE